MDSFKDQTIEMQSDAGPNRGLKNEHYFKLYNDTNHEEIKESIQEKIQILENNERQTKCILENSKSEPADEWKIDLMEISRMNNTDKCPKCGAVKILLERFCGIGGVHQLALICKECHL